MTVRPSWQWCGAIIIVAVTAALYLPFIGNEMVFDDQNISAMMLSYADIPFNSSPRTFPYFTLGFTQVLFGTVQAHRIASLLIHATNALLLWSVLTELLATIDQGSSGNSRWLALFGALAFAVHPVAVYGAGYLAQRTILFALFFSLLSLRCFMRWMENGRRQDVFAAAVFYALAVFSKEHAILVSAAVVAVAPLYRLEFRKMFARIWPYLALTLPISTYVVLVSKGVIGSRYEPFINDFSQPESGSWWLSAATQMGLFFDYLHLWLLPDLSRMAIDIRVPIDSTGLFLKAFFYVAFGSVALALLFRRGRVALLGYGMLYCWILFGVEFSTVRFQEIFVLYRSYLWAPGFALIGTAIFAFVPTSGFRLIVGAAIFGFLAWQAHDRLQSMRTSLAVWTDARDKLHSHYYPGAYRIYANRAQVLSSMGQDQAALLDANRAIALQQDSATAYATRGFIYLKIKDGKNALSDFELALKVWPSCDIFKGYLFYGEYAALVRLGCQAEAKTVLDQAKQCGFKPIEIDERARASIMKLRSTSQLL